MIMENIYDEFKNITMTGRICYLFMCIEKYLITLYPNNDWTPIAKRMWQWTNKFWNKSWDIYSEAVPEFILEFDTYEETNIREYEGNLKEDDYKEIIACFKGITNGNENDEICQVLMFPIDFGNFCDGASFYGAEPYVLEILSDMRKILLKHSIPVPDTSKLTCFTFERGKRTRIDEPELGWGGLANTEYLSIILN